MNETLVRKAYEAIAEIYSIRENVKITVKNVRQRKDCDIAETAHNKTAAAV